MRKSIIVLGILITLVILITACSGTAKNIGGQTVYSPKWYTQTENDIYIFANALGESVNQNVSNDQAEARAYSGIVLSQRAYVETRLHSYLGSAGVDNELITQATNRVVTAIGNSNIIGSKIIERETKFYQDEKIYRTWVQLGIPKANILKELENRLQREEALYSEFKDSQATQLMQKEIRELEERERSKR